MSENQINFIKKIKKEKKIIFIFQIFISIFFIVLWQLLANFNVINTFIYSSPLKIIQTIQNLYLTNNLFIHIFVTLYETLITFVLGIGLGFIIAIFLYEFKLVAKILDPYLTMINSLPKIALGPLIIIIAGANTKSIIIMALLINLIISIMTIYTGFLNTDKTKIKLLQSFNATKIQILKNLIIPSSFNAIISSLKINISMSLVGVIMGEFLVSKAGIGYLIIYGTQIFNLNLVYTGIIFLIILSLLLYKIVALIEKKLLKHS